MYIRVRVRVRNKKVYSIYNYRMKESINTEYRRLINEMLDKTEAKRNVWKTHSLLFVRVERK